MNLENQKYQLCVARQKGYKFSKNFVIPPAVYAAGSTFWDSLGVNDEPDLYSNLDKLPDWTGDMDAAWSLAEEMHAGGLDCLLASPSENSSQWIARFWNETWSVQESADTPQLAICKAWLKWRLVLNAKNGIG